MRFVEALEGVPLLSAFGDADVSSVCIDSRKVSPGSVFVCMPGRRADSHQFVDQAISGGAAAVVVSDLSVFDQLRKRESCSALVQDCEDACWRICKRVYGDPSTKLKLVGVTGTNGKTTTAWILAGMFGNAGLAAAYSGTLGVLLGGEQFQQEFTTPFAPEANETLVQLAARGASHAVMEVSSHALDQGRANGLEFATAIFTNLTQDHLDYHNSMESYFAAKARLFEGVGTGKPPVCVLNCDDPYGRVLSMRHPEALTFGTADVRLKLVRSDVSATELKFDFIFEGRTYSAQAQLGAHFNLSNCLAALGGAIATGLSADEAVCALAKISAAPGRFESIPTGEDFAVIVDYAHTPDAIEKLLQSVNQLKPTGVLTVFGCGGDRDRTKRPKMAAAASKYSTKLFVTSDNPRTESPTAIIEEVVSGIEGVEYVVEVDRRKAIRNAIFEARHGEVVVIAGKGHEDYQIIGTEKISFDDRVEARKAIEERRK